jgi:biopolymer transport protein ExbD/biopolymer transport protein TolR
MAFTTQDGRTRSSLAEINMVPFIDVVLVLLIIFMITAPVLDSALPVEVPDSQFGQSVDEQNLTVTIDRERRLYVEDEPASLDQLVGMVQSNLPPSPGNIYLRSDETVPFATIAAVLDRLAMAGIRNVNLVTEPILSTP